jgi:hypothetical protein
LKSYVGEAAVHSHFIGCDHLEMRRVSPSSAYSISQGHTSVDDLDFVKLPAKVPLVQAKQSRIYERERGHFVRIYGIPENKEPRAERHYMDLTLSSMDGRNDQTQVQSCPAGGGNAQGNARTRNMFAPIVCSIAAVPSPLGSNTNSDEGKI